MGDAIPFDMLVFYLVWLPFDALSIVCYIISCLAYFTDNPIGNPLEDGAEGSRMQAVA